MWFYEYVEDNDETKIIHDGETVGIVEGEITSWIGGLPRGDAKDVLKNVVDDPMVVDLLYGFSEVQE